MAVPIMKFSSFRLSEPKWILLFCLPIALLPLGAQTKAVKAPDHSKEWPTYGHDAGGMRFSPLTQLTPANVGSLKPAWVYHMKPAGVGAVSPFGPVRPGGPVGDDPGATRGSVRGRAGGFGPSTVTPLVVNGTMYLTTPYGRVVAIDATSGKEVWATPLPGGGGPATRGLEYWPGEGKTPPQVVFGSGDGRLFSLDARTGKPNENFGDNGVVKLNTEELMRGLPGRNGLSSPPIVYKNLVITGGTTQENPPLGPAGDIRAWDMHTGKLVWTFHSIPKEGEKFNDTWAKDSWKDRTGVNVWGFLTVDVERGIVYMPFGAPSVDQYGGDRHGDNLFSTSLVAADAKTGKYLWHFQFTHHDIWDADLTGAPALIEVKRGGKTIPAVAATSKVGCCLFLTG
jgi:quinoprotein glucose dehydrogenase